VEELENFLVGRFDVEKFDAETIDVEKFDVTATSSQEIFLHHSLVQQEISACWRPAILTLEASY